MLIKEIMVSVSMHHIFTKDNMSVLKYNNYFDLVCFAICEINSVSLVEYFIIFLFGCSLGHTIHT